MPKPSAWLFLDTHAPGQSRFAFFEPGKPIKPVQIEGRASALLPRLHKYFTLYALRFTELAGVCVVAGPGSFSAVRAGVLQANLIARLLKLPLVGVTVDEAQDLDILRNQLFSKLETGNWKLKTTQYVAPIYDKEPNITIPKPA